MKYRSEIDGLRALAVVPVILFHAKFQLFSGGYVGVDIFFVISGYLITTILINEIENKTFSIVNFYERRARRILPALFLVLMISIFFAWIWMLPSQMKDFSQSVSAISLFVSNILFWKETGYFDTAGEKPLLHTWSLAVEEQYYLLFPIFLIFFWRFGKKKVFLTIIFITIISFILSEWASKNSPIANFYLAPTRVWELLVGSISAIIIDRNGIKKNNLFALCGLSAIIYPIFYYDQNTPFPSVYTLMPVLGTMILILYANKETFVAKILSYKLFVGVGLISYSAYLWHQPIFTFVNIKYLNQKTEIFMFVLSIFSLIVAYFSWRYIERPFRKISSPTFSSRFILFFSSIGIFLFLIFGFFGDYTNGFKNRFLKSYDGDVGQLEYHKYIDENYIDCEPKEIADEALTWEGFLRCKQSKKGEFDWLLLGDSHAEHLFIGLANENPNLNVAFYIFGDPPYIENKTFEKIFDTIAHVKESKTIFLTMYYNRRAKNLEDFFNGFSGTINYLQKLGHEVVLISGLPRFNVHAEYCKYSLNINNPNDNCLISVNKFLEKKKLYFSTLERISSEFKVKIINIHEPLCDDNHCDMRKKNTILFRDNNHLNIPGSVLIGQFITNQFYKNFTNN